MIRRSSGYVDPIWGPNGPPPFDANDPDFEDVDFYTDPRREQEGAPDGNRRDQASGTNPRSSRVIDPTTLYGLPVPERRWIVPEWLPCGHVTLNYGDGGTGKTLLSQQLMTSSATGLPWIGMAVKRCRTFAFYCEDDFDELHRRQVAICQAYGIALTDLGDMRWMSGVGEDNLLVTFDQDGRLRLTPRYEEIAREAKDFGAELIVIDTAADTFGGNENDRSQVRQFIGHALNRLAIEAKGAVLLNAHPSRSGLSATGDMDGGSTGWSNSARSRWSLSRPKGEDGEPTDTNERILTKRKANYSAIGDDIKLRWVSGVLVPPQRPGAAFAGAYKQIADDVFLTLLKRCAEQGIYVHHTNTSTLYAPKIFAKRPDRDGHTAKDFDMAMNRLFSNRVNQGPRVTRTKTATPATASSSPKCQTERVETP